MTSSKIITTKKKKTQKNIKSQITKHMNYASNRRNEFIGVSLIISKHQPIMKDYNDSVFCLELTISWTLKKILQ